MDIPSLQGEIQCDGNVVRTFPCVSRTYAYIRYRFGAFRVAFLSSLGRKNLEDSSVFYSHLSARLDSTVFKTLRYELDFNYESYESIRMDALLSEKLSRSSRIVDIYGFCGLSILSEALMHGDLMDLAVPNGGYLKEPRVDKEKLHDHSPFSPEKKLELALDMVEAVVLLHSYPGGVMVHDDIQLTQVRSYHGRASSFCLLNVFIGQFLFTEKGSLKLNDFNRAEVMLFDEEHEEYCRYRNNPGVGDVSAYGSKFIVISQIHTD
jgi:hypothetical protein